MNTKSQYRSFHYDNESPTLNRSCAFSVCHLQLNHRLAHLGALFAVIS
jgi:hypothetical protein